MLEIHYFILSGLQSTAHNHNCFQSSISRSICCEAAVTDLIFFLLTMQELCKTFVWQVGGKRERDRCMMHNLNPVKFQRLTKVCWNVFTANKATSHDDFIDHVFLALTIWTPQVNRADAQQEQCPAEQSAGIDLISEKVDRARKMKTAYSTVPPYSQLPLSGPYKFLAFTAPKNDGESKYNYYWNEWPLPNDAFWTIGTHHIKTSTKYGITKSKVELPMRTIEICNWNTTYPSLPPSSLVLPYEGGPDDFP